MHSKLAVFVVSAFAIGATPAQPQSAPPANPAQLDSIVRVNFADKGIVGLSVGVMQDGKVVFAKGYGMASLAKNAAVTPATMFPIGSVTKQFTCSAVLLLAEDKKLQMSDPVAKYFPKLTRAKEITLLDLGQHDQSGASPGRGPG